MSGRAELPKTLSDEERGRILNERLTDYYAFSEFGCLPMVLNMATGRVERNLAEITRVAGVGGRGYVEEVLTKVTWICVGCETREKAFEMLEEKGFLKDVTTLRNPNERRQAQNVAILATITFNCAWKSIERAEASRAKK